MMITKQNKMKTLPTLIAALGLMVIPAAYAEEKKADGHAGHDHGDHVHVEKKAGPNGGRVIDAVEPHVEFFVMPDRKLKLTFLGEDGKAVAAKEQSATAVGGDRSKPTRIKFAKQGDALVSDVVLPDGKMVPLILQFKVTPDAKTVTVKFTVNLSQCSGCDYLEYACTCAH